MNHLIDTDIKRDGSGSDRAFQAVLFLLVTFIFTFFPLRSASVFASAMQGGVSTSVTMDVSCGFGDTAKGDRYIPARISLENKTEQNFSGVLEILTTESSREVYRYDYPVQIEASGSFKEVYYVPLGVKGDQVFVTLRDADGSEVIKKRVKLNISGDVAESLIGVLSDTSDKLTYFDQIGIKYGTIRTRLVPLAQETLPEDSRGLAQLDLIVVSDYEFDRLSEKQRKCIMRWVDEGGTVLFGGGASYEKNLGQLGAEILEGAFGEPTLRPVNLGEEYSKNAPQEAVLDLVCADLELKNGSTLMEGDGFPLLSYVHQKKGRIVVAAFALSDINEFCEEHLGFGEKFYTKTLGESKVTELSQMDYYGFSNLYFSTQGLINTGNVDRLPNVVLYTVLMIFYVLLIGPVLYIILKKKSLQRYYIGAVAVCAVLFTVTIYAVGSKTRFRGPFFTYATILDTSKTGTQELTLINVRSPFNKPYTVELSPEYTVRPITKSYYYDSYTVSEFTGEEGYKTALIKTENGTEIRVRDTAAFTPKMFTLSKQVNVPVNTGIESNVCYFDGQVSGSIVNKFDYKLEDAVLIFYGRAILLGDLEPGQQVNLSEYEILNYPLNYTYAFAQTATGADQYEKADINDETYMLAQERTRLLSFHMDQSMNEYTPGAIFAAFSPDKNEKTFLLEENPETDGLTMVTSEIDVQMEREGLLYRSAMEKNPNVISGNFNVRYNSMYTGEPSDPAVIEYSLGNNMEIVKLKFDHLSSVFQGNSKYPYLAAFKGKMYFYNYDTGRNDLMEQNKTEFEAWELEPYLSPTNTITIKFANEETSEYVWDRLLPLIYAIGRDK